MSGMTKPADTPYESPCPIGTAPIAVWRFVFDCDDDQGGGFVSGELLLRSDGKMLRRMGYSVTGFASGKAMTTWEYQAWREVADWPGGLSPDDAIAWLKAKHYDLCEASPCPIDRAVSDPVEGTPEIPKYL